MPDAKQPEKKKRESLNDLLARRKERKADTPLPGAGAGDAAASPKPAAEAFSAPLAADQQRILDAMDGKLEEDPASKYPVLTLSIDLIDPNPTPQRTVYLDNEIRVIAESMKETKQRDAVHVRPNPDAPGRYIICDGWTRVLAHKLFGEELGLSNTVEARVHAGMTAKEGALYGFRQNKERHETTDFDDGFFIRDLLNVYGMSREEVMEQLELKFAQELSQLLSFVGLAPEILERIKPYKRVFTKSYAAPLKHIQDAHGVGAAQKALDEILTEKDGQPAIKPGSTRWLEKYRHRLDLQQAVGQAPGSVANSAPGSVPVRHGKFCKLEDRGNSLEVKFKHKDLSPAQKLALREEIQALFQKYFPIGEA